MDTLHPAWGFVVVYVHPPRRRLEGPDGEAAPLADAVAPAAADAATPPDPPTVADFILATRTVFHTEAAARRYAAGIALEGATPRVVVGRFFSLRDDAPDRGLE